MKQERTFDQTSSLMRLLSPIALLFVLGASGPLLAQVADAGMDGQTCGDQGWFTLANSPIPPATGAWTLVQGCGTLADPTNPSTYIINLCIGINIWRWTIVDGSGNQTTDDLTISVFDDQAPDAFAGPDMLVTGPPNMVQLDGSIPIAPMTCLWTIPSGMGSITDPTAPNTYVTDLGVGTNVFRWTCFNGPCSNGITLDDVSVEFMMTTGISTTAQDAAPVFRYDPRAQKLVVDGTRRIEDLMIMDALGRSMPLNTGQASERTWNVGQYPSGLYVLRALVDEKLQVFRFVVER